MGFGGKVTWGGRASFWYCSGEVGAQEIAWGEGLILAGMVVKILCRYVVPTGRVVVPTGRYVVPTGRVVVPTG
nr:hypothetical protein [Tanacetum cinerariifolium]